MNKDRREKFRRWFYGALVPCISIKGKIRYVGTILHNDSMLESLMPKEWHKGTVVTPLKVYNTRKQPWLSIKYRAHSDDFQHILWSQNYDKQYFIELRQDYINQGIPDVYSQEYLNRPIDETLSYFKRRDFIGLEKEDKAKALRYYITGDLAISQAETADYTVFVVAGVDEDKHIHIKNVIRERLDGREIVDTILALEKQYQPEAIGIEEMQVSKAIGPFLREEMIRSNVFPTLIKLKHQGKDKISRARSMQARLRAQSVKFEKGQDWYQTFEDECVTFPRGKHDDQVDAFAYLGMLLDIIIEAPTKQEAEEEIYLDELRASGLSDAGRSAVTGY
jgi:predicted phage terminase large subunit-like protein